MDEQEFFDAWRIVIVAADPLVRAGLAAQLDGLQRPGLQTVGQLDATERWSEELSVYRPTAVLLDLGWDAATVDLTSLEEVDLPLVVLLDDPALLPELLRLGCAGMLSRRADGAQLVAAFEAVLNGLTTLDPLFLESLAPDLQPDDLRLVEPLTPREQEVLEQLAAGLTNKGIGQALDISPHTVKFHVSAILEKLEAASRTEAVVRATQLGLLPV